MSGAQSGYALRCEERDASRLQERDHFKLHSDMLKELYETDDAFFDNHGLSRLLVKEPDMQVYQYIVICKPTEDERKAGQKPKVIVEMATVMAKDEAEVRFLAARAVPAEYADKSSQLETQVRPF